MARDFAGTFPEDPYWADDGNTVYFFKRIPGSEIRELFRIYLESKRVEKVPDSERSRVEGPGGVVSPDRRRRAFVRDGDLFVKGFPRGVVEQWTRTSVEESDPVWIEGGKRLAFREGNRLLAIDVATRQLATLLELRFEKDPDESEEPPSFLSAQQLALFEVLRERKARADQARARERELAARDPGKAPQPWYLGPDRALEKLALSPSGSLVAVLVRPETHPNHREDPSGRRDSMPRFVTESGYVEVSAIRPKVGTGIWKTPELWLLDLVTRQKIRIELDRLPGVEEDPLQALRPKGKDSASERGVRGPRPLEIRDLLWNEAGDRLALQIFSRDQKDRWLVGIDRSGKLEVYEHEFDPAWLGWKFDDFGWMRDGKTLWFLSERTGWSHLYLRLPTGERRALTQGDFEIDRPVLSRDGKSFLVVANREHPGRWEAYRVDVASSQLEQLTHWGGIVEPFWSPDERQLLFLGSTRTKPPELFVQATRSGAKAVALTKSTTPEFDQVAWIEPEVVAVPSRHGAGEIWARLYLPPNPPNVKGKRPAVLFVHGAGYLQNAHFGWSRYYREFFFHTFLARRGIVVLDMDYRASAGYGRAWRTAIYRQMGHPELEDLADGVAWLVETQGVDPERVGIYGGSYGGFLTLMALFREPELFRAGAALRPVTDWAHYQDWYTSAILNTPEEDPDSYRRSSPIEYAAGLQRPLLICHGMVDDNVAFQDTVRLVQRLIELGKTELFEVAIYPVEGHAFVEPSSWVDEYRRIWRLFRRTLFEEP
jgi:dipeptidyl aminopeptidase/acylaminoacyl peptidase